MTTIKLIPYTTIRELGADLLAEYAAECSIAAIGTPDPQWDMYAALERVNVLAGLGVYVDGSLAGFAVLLLTVLPHYGVKVATVESLFVGKRYRGTGAGTQLLAAADVCAGVSGCKAILYSAPAGGQLEAILGKRYQRTNSVFCKPLCGSA